MKNQVTFKSKVAMFFVSASTCARAVTDMPARARSAPAACVVNDLKQRSAELEDPEDRRMLDEIAAMDLPSAKRLRALSEPPQEWYDEDFGDLW